MIFSGSAVFDAQNTSGLGRPDAPPLVAVYTGRRAQEADAEPRLQPRPRPDRGRSSRAIPVLDIDSNSFRDPKVFWHEPTSRWIMATVLADERKVRLWGSTDLKSLGEAERLRPGRLGQGRLGMPRAVRGPGRRAGHGRIALGAQGRRERRRPVRRLGRPVLRRPLRRQGVPPRGDEARRPALDRLRQGLLCLADLERCPAAAGRCGSPG